MKLGMIGCDTSHCLAFAKMLHLSDDPDHLPGGQIVKAFPGGSPEFELSASRVDGISRELAETYGVTLVSTIAEALEGVDAVLLESVDGRQHLEQFKMCAQAGKPVFIDKPLTVSSVDAKALVDIAAKQGIPILSASALRWADDLDAALAETDGGALYGADMQGPMAFQPPLPGYFWYGIHAVEMLYRALGTGCRDVTVRSTERDDILVGQWSGGRIGTVRGNRHGNGFFAGTLHRERGSRPLANASNQSKSFYHRLLREILQFFKTGVSPVPGDEMMEVIRFVEAANESRATGRTVTL
jgi:predicted dehydrogenase